ncbi:MAG: hypothetical protein P4M08_14765 [Oligoflexia bacterium]|nr:hypothetical protein [Oligoflexia bacterium]
MTSFSSTEPEIHVKRHTPDSPWTYALLDRFQREIAARVRAGGAGALILSELAPVITLGKRSHAGAKSEDLLVSRSFLASQGVEVLQTDRGGLATYHGPGQWVLFVVDSLERLTGDSRGVRSAVESLMNIALTVGLEYDSTASIREGAETGVWTSRGKFASVGVHIQDRVLLHGLSVNGFRTPTSFLGIRPCGLDAHMDFLLRSEGKANSEAFLELGERLRQQALQRFWKNSRHRSLTGLDGGPR